MFQKEGRANRIGKTGYGLRNVLWTWKEGNGNLMKAQSVEWWRWKPDLAGGIDE